MQKNQTSTNTLAMALLARCILKNSAYSVVQNTLYTSLVGAEVLQAFASKVCM